MSFSLGSITKPFKKVINKVGSTVDKVDPTGISGMLATGGIHQGGMLGSGIDKFRGKGGKSSSTAAPKRERYKRRKRNKWKSKREKAFESKQTAKKSRSLTRMVTSGIAMKIGKKKK